MFHLSDRTSSWSWIRPHYRLSRCFTPLSLVATLCFFYSQDIQRSTQRGAQEWIFVLARLISALLRLYNYGANGVFLCAERGCSWRSDSHLKGTVWTKMNNLDLFVNVKKPRLKCHTEQLIWHEPAAGSWIWAFAENLNGISAGCLRFMETDVRCGCMIFSFIHFSSLNAREENSVMLLFFLKSL